MPAGAAPGPNPFGTSIARCRYSRSGSVAELLEQGPGAGGVGVVRARRVGVEGLQDTRCRAGGHLRTISHGAVLHGEDEGGPDPSPAMRGVDPARGVEQRVGLLVPGVGGGDDRSAGLRHDPCVGRWVEAWAHPLVVHRALGDVVFTDVPEVACPADRDDGGDVVEDRGAHPIARCKGRPHPPIVASAMHDDERHDPKTQLRPGSASRDHHEDRARQRRANGRGGGGMVVT